MANVQNLTKLLEDATKNRYAVGSFSARYTKLIKPIIQAAINTNSPAIVQLSEKEVIRHKVGVKEFADEFYRVVKELDPKVPLALHLDHTKTLDVIREAMDAGFTSVMIDASSKPFEENIEITKKVVEYAHAHGVVVEAELGTLAGIEDEVVVEAGHESYTRPEEVEEFVSRTGCDSLAIAIGTSHGAYKFTPDQCTRNADGVLVPPPLRFDVLEECIKRLPGFPIVLHGSSSVPQEFVKMVNQYGGNMPDAVGIPEEQLRKAAQLAVCKINIDSDLRVAFTAAIRKHLAENPSHFDPRQYLGDARANMKEMVKHKIVDVLGSANKA